MKQLHALAALIDEVRSANGWSDPDIVARAQSKGHKLSKSNISRIRNNPVVTLNIETVSALADGLGVSKAMVAGAALASMGIVMYSGADLTTEDAIRRDSSLGERDKRALLVLLAGLRDERSAHGQDTHDAQRNQPEGMQPADIRNQDPEPSDSGAGQKTRERRLRAVKHPDEDESGNIPLPDNWQDLAAYSDGSTRHVDRQREWDELGEESQEGDE